MKITYFNFILFLRETENHILVDEK